MSDKQKRRDRLEAYKKAKRSNGSNFKQYRPSVQLTRKDKAERRSNIKLQLRKDLEDLDV